MLFNDAQSVNQKEFSRFSVKVVVNASGKSTPVTGCGRDARNDRPEAGATHAMRTGPHIFTMHLDFELCTPDS